MRAVIAVLAWHAWVALLALLRSALFCSAWLGSAWFFVFLICFDCFVVLNAGRVLLALLAWFRSVCLGFALPGVA